MKGLFSNTNFLLIKVLVFAFLIQACTNTPESPKENQIINQYLWEDSTAIYLPKTKQWTNRVEVADLNQDGLIDLIFANGGNYSDPGPPEQVRIFFNQGAGKKFLEKTNEIFGDQVFWSRVVKAKDINNDGLVDLIVGCTFQSQTQLYLGQGKGIFKNATITHLPQINASVGDIEIGDVDLDGDLDLVLSNWGKGSNMRNNGGLTLLWLNDGNGHFKDFTKTRMPEVLIGFSWDLELIDFDNDYDLDIAISCKRCAGSRIFQNNGIGFFEEIRAIPAYTNNYELEPMDVNLDGYIDLLTVNDGEIVDQIPYSRREHIFIHNKKNSYVDATSTNWPDSANIGEDDNNIVFLDYDSDGDPDFLLSSLTGEDRLLVNDGKGIFSLKQPILKNNNTPHTLSMVLGDINDDCRLDIIMGQGEGDNNIDERIFIGTNILPDTSDPIITNTHFSRDTINQEWTVWARIHDHKSPISNEDFEEVILTDDQNKKLGDLEWYGGYLWKYSSSLALKSPQLKIRAMDKCLNVTIYTMNL